jgi:nicotinate-nucleotide adenylyltransferase
LDDFLPDQTWDCFTTPVEPSRPNKVAIFGGTFNPIHYAHLAVAEQTRRALGLDWVLFMPAGVPPLKTSVAPAVDRACMVELAIADNPHFALSQIELQREGPSYTADTLRGIITRLTQDHVATDLSFIISTETLSSLPTWHEGQKIPALCRLIVTTRAGSARPTTDWLEANFPGQTNRFVFVDTLTGAYSSSDVRGLVAAGQTPRYLVPETVYEYFTNRGLYQPKEI